MKPLELELIEPPSLEEACSDLGKHHGKLPSWQEALPSRLPFVTDSGNPEFTSEKVLKNTGREIEQSPGGAYEATAVSVP